MFPGVELLRDHPDVWVFGPNTSGTGGLPLQVWERPHSTKSCLFVLCIGAGSGGVGGISVGGGAGNGGGGGGASSGVARCIFPMWMIPERLYIYVGEGGAGGAAGSGAPGTGELSYVSAFPNITVTNNFLIRSGNAVATAGSATTAGVGSTVQTIANCSFAQWGLFKATVGSNGATGGNAGGGVNVSLSASTALITGGAGGGDEALAGGGLNAVTNTPFIAMSGGAGSTAGVPGSPAFRHAQNQVPAFIGGLGGGGGGVSGASGGNGYNIPGVGGGGGGGGGASTGGVGGAGGGGLVILAMW